MDKITQHVYIDVDIKIRHKPTLEHEFTCRFSWVQRSHVGLHGKWMNECGEMDLLYNDL